MQAGLLSLVLLVVVCVAWGQPPRPPMGGGGATTCSSNFASFETPSATSQCENFQTGNTYRYPEDFPVLSSVDQFVCEKSGLRIIVSNGIPDHDVKIGNPNSPCEIPWFISMPLNGTYQSAETEVAPLGIIAVAVNGVPIYGAMEAEGLNAVEPSPTSFVQDAQYWYGHAAPNHDWHYHNPWAGNANQPNSSTLVGYALDGFPIYGVLDDDTTLDACNGRWLADNYQYHIVRPEVVDGEGDYCNGSSPAINWRYTLGCYHGSVAKTTVKSSSGASIPSDCVRV